MDAVSDRMDAVSNRMDAVSNNSDWTNVLNYDIMFAL